jgi:hypothetical protein
MKTSNFLPRFMQNSSAIVIALFASSSILSSCQKEDSLRPALSKSELADKTTIAALQQLPNPNLERVYVMATIDHITGRGFGKNYKVTIMSNGLVQFEGRRNVAVIGQQEFLADAASLAYVKNLFLAGHFFEIQDHFVYIPDANEVFTSFSNGEMVKQLADHDDGEPQLLIQIRKAAEEKLGISRFLNKASLSSEYTKASSLQ